MPKKFVGENTKAAEARARKNAVKEAEEEKKQKAVEDAYWADDDKHVLRKLQRKEDKMKKKQDNADRKALNKELHDQEMNSLRSIKPVSVPKVTRAQINSGMQRKLNATEKEKVVMHDELPIQENANRLISDEVNARSVDDAISALSLTKTDVERHPERRMKAAYETFEQQTLPKLKAENPNLRLSQLKQLLKKEWLKSPNNPMNQMCVAYNEPRN